MAMKIQIACGRLPKSVFLASKRKLAVVSGISSAVLYDSRGHVQMHEQKPRGNKMRIVLYSLLSLCLFVTPIFGQQKSEGNENPLVEGKLMYVGPMPDNIDGWIVHDLQAWGKYKPTREIEGVDLVMKAFEPERRTRFEMRNGIPQPTRKPEKGSRKSVMFSISVSDWVTGRLLWQAEVLDKKPKKNASVTPSEDVEIRARRLTTQQIAQAITRELRRYVDNLSPHPAGQ